MYRSTPVLLVMLVGIAGLTAFPDRADAQKGYRCPVTIEMQGKNVLQGEIRDTERPSTAELWNLLKSLSFGATKAGQGVSDLKSADKATLKGKIQVKVAGAGQVQVAELNLVRNKLNPEAWVIAPEDVARILKIQSGADKKQPKK